MRLNICAKYPFFNRTQTWLQNLGNHWTIFFKKKCATEHPCIQSHVSVANGNYFLPFKNKSYLFLHFEKVAPKSVAYKQKLVLKSVKQPL